MGGGQRAEGRGRRAVRAARSVPGDARRRPMISCDRGGRPLCYQRNQPQRLTVFMNKERKSSLTRVVAVFTENFGLSWA